METRLEHVLTNFYKDEMIAHMEKYPEDFTEAIQLAVSDKQPWSWRAAWLLCCHMEENDLRIRDHLKPIIDSILLKKAGHQRELIKIIQKMEISEEEEGNLFDICIIIWEKISNQPSVRWHALKTIVDIAKRHPGLFNEIVFLTDDRYMDTLSPGIKSSVYRMIREISK